MSNTIYIDANRLNSIAKQDATNEWTYKLNTEMELPKGTQISIQNSFINKKGITGGSLEIDEDIIEEITYTFYATEQPHFSPLGHYAPDTHYNTWCRQTWGADPANYRGCFDDVATGVDFATQQAKVNAGTASIGMDDIKRLVRGETFQDVDYAKNAFNPDLVNFGGTNMICPMVEWATNPAGGATRHLNPVAFTMKIFIPKGVYSIGSIAQLIEDQFNGLIYNAGTDTKIKMKRQEDTKRRAEDYSTFNTSLLPFDGQPYNRPLITQVNALRRDYNLVVSDPKDPFIDVNIGHMRGFTTMPKFNELVNYGKFTDNPRRQNIWAWENCSNKGSGAFTDNQFSPFGIAPFFFFRQNYDTGANADGMVHTKDPDETIVEYQLYGYDADAHNRRFRQVGTSNFQFKYNTEQNAYTIGGLHNQMRSPSHDRFGSKNPSAGQPVINLKKINNNAVILDNGSGNPVGTDKGNIDRAEIIGRLNNPETRNMGVMIMNWGKSTALKFGDNIKSTTAGGNYVDDGTGRDKPLFEDFLRFGECFTTDTKAREAWKKTIWFRLGFQYDDIQNHNYNECFGTTQCYNKKFTDENGITHTTGFPNYGFTTDEVIDNTIIPTISGQNNPVSFKPTGNDDFVSGFQLYTLDNFGLPNLSIGTSGGTKDLTIQPQYAGGLLLSSPQIPVVVADVGDVLATELPTLSNSAYFLITSDICDNYKDNVKKGDVLPLLGVVPKTNLSNQDFIVAENQITQVLSQTKVINKISVKVLNADLTAPDLAPNSSILLKIVKPNTTPNSLLEQENPKIYQQLQQASQTY